jgi:hypothetical protein
MADETQPEAPEATQTIETPQKAAEAAVVVPVEVAAAAVPVDPVVVNQFTRRSGDDALPGSWVDIIAGEHEGRRGAYVGDVSHGQDGYPDRVLVRTRDADNLLIEVGYGEVRPSSYTGGR